MRRARVAFGLLMALACAAPDEGGLPRGRVSIQGQIVAVEVARTSATRQQGLSGRASLEPDTGLLFLHPAVEPLAYWMKDMRFAIDILWIRAGRIVHVSHRVPAPDPGEDGREILAKSRVPADSVLELPAGYARSHGFDVGQRVVIELDEDARTE